MLIMICGDGDFRVNLPKGLGARADRGVRKFRNARRYTKRRLAGRRLRDSIGFRLSINLTTRA